jgi:hypothetical protein
LADCTAGANLNAAKLHSDPPHEVVPNPGGVELQTLSHRDQTGDLSVIREALHGATTLVALEAIAFDLAAAARDHALDALPATTPWMRSTGSTNCRGSFEARASRKTGVGMIQTSLC